MMSRMRVYHKISIIFAILIIPMLFINILTNKTGIDLIREEYSKSIVNNSDFFSKQLDSQLMYIKKLQFQLLNDSDLHKLGFQAKILDPLEKTELINKIRERMVQLLDSIPYLSSVSIYIESLDSYLTVGTDTSKKTDQEWNEIESAYAADYPSPFYSSGGNLYLIQSESNESIRSYVELSTRKIEQSLEPFYNSTGFSGATITDASLTYHLSPRESDVVWREIRPLLVAAPLHTNSAMVTASQEKYYLTAHPISALGLILYTYLNESEISGKMNVLNRWFFIFGAVCLFVFIVFLLIANRMMHQPLKHLVSTLKQLDEDNLDMAVSKYQKNEFGYVYRSLQNLTNRLRNTMQLNLRHELSLQRSELKQLQTQIKPHFLYNAFFNISMLCKAGDYDKVKVFAQKLGSYYQFITRSGHDEVPLESEFRHALDYLEIQQIRFPNRVEATVSELPDACRSTLVPRLILQPILENAFEHAFESKRADGKLFIGVICEEERTLVVTVEDNGDALEDSRLAELQEKLADPSAVSEKTGMTNVSERIRLSYGPRSGITVSRSAHGGMKVTLKMEIANGGNRHV